MDLQNNILRYASNRAGRNPVLLGCPFPSFEGRGAGGACTLGLHTGVLGLPARGPCVGGFGRRRRLHGRCAEPPRVYNARVDWTIFYAATAAASATLLGLLFVAIQLHIDTLSSDPLSRWRALARSTFDHYTALFILSLLMLYPQMNGTMFAVFVLFVALPGIPRLLWVWAPVWRRMFRDQRGQFVELLWLVASPLSAYLAMVVLAIQILHGGSLPDLQPIIGYCVVGLFSIVLRNSWKLTMEMTLEKRESDGGAQRAEAPKTSQKSEEQVLR